MIRSILSNLPALIVILPMFVAPILAMLPTNKKYVRTIIWQIGFLCFGLIFAASFYLAAVVFQTGPFSYYFGAWPVPIGIEYEATKLNTLLLALISGIAFVLFPYGKVAVEAEISHKKTGIFYAVFLLMVAGLLGMVITNDIFNIFVFMEISSLATYALVAMGSDKRALTAAFNYLIVGTIAGTLFLAGVAFLYVLTGSLNISDIAYQLGQTQPNKLEVVAIVFLFIALAIKGAIMPFAGWMPRVYAHAPAFVVAFIAAVSSKVPLYILAKVFYVMFGKDVALQQFSMSYMLIILAIIGIIFGAIAAFMQTNFRRLLAFSSISSIGYIVLGIGIGSKTAVAAAIILFVAHAIAKSGLFIIAGIGKNSAAIMALIFIFVFSLVGLPLTFGFIPKWYFLVAASELNGATQIIVFIGLIAGALLSCLYGWKIINMAFANNNSDGFVSVYSYFSLLTLAALVVGLGIFSEPLANYCLAIAGGLIK